MANSPSVLVITTQVWLQITRLAMRLTSYGCRVSVLCPEESHLSYAPGVAKRFHYRLGHPSRSLRQAITASGADYVLPTDDLSVWALHDLAEETPSLRPLIERSLGSSEHYPLLRSRFDLLSLAHELGIAVPRTERILEPADLEPWCRSENGFVMKKDGTWGGSGVQIVHTPEQAHDAFLRLGNPTSFRAKMLRCLRNGDRSAFANLRCLGQPEITAQTLIEGAPANSMYVCDRGRILGEVQARVAASKGKTGPSLVVQLIDDPRITRAGALLAEALQLSGCFGLDFILDAHTGEPMLIELNPRSTQLGHIALANQPDLAGRLWAHWANQPLPRVGDTSLGRSICFYPDAELWTQNTASFPGCRRDVLVEEEAMLAQLARGDRRLKARLRHRLRNSLLHLRGSLQSETVQQAFYYQDLTGRANVEPTSTLAQTRKPGVCAPNKIKVFTHA